MSFSVIAVGASPNDGTGDPLRTAFGKINDNFAVFNAAALAVPLSGLNTALTGAVTATDTILQGFGKVEHRLALNDAKVTYPFSGSQTQNRVLASPNGSAGTLTVRALVAGDIPVLSFSKIGGVTSQTLAGRATAGAGVLEEITLGSGLTLTGNVLSAAGGGGGGDGSVPSGAYGVGNPPTFIPSGSAGVAINTDEEKIWWYYSFAWH